MAKDELDELRKRGFVVRKTYGNAALLEKDGKQQLYYEGKIYPYNKKTGVNRESIDQFLEENARRFIGTKN